LSATADAPAPADPPVAAHIPAAAVAITTAPGMPSLSKTRIPLLPSQRTTQNKQLVRMARERGITPVTPN
jgi:hypothetical protein